MAGAAASAWRFLKGAFDDQALRWPLLFPFALVAGAAIYMTSPDEPGWVLLALVTAPPAVAWAFLRRGRSALALACGLLACAGFGAAAGKVRTELMAAPVLHEEIGPDQGQIGGVRMGLGQLAGAFKCAGPFARRLPGVESL